MNLAIPNLDDRTFDDLVAEGLALIPVHAPQWTNHNASDPGITLLELIAYVTEILLYRINRVELESRLAFLQLLRGEPDDPTGLDGIEDSAEADAAIRKLVAGFALPSRIVTKADAEELSHAAAAAHYGDEVRTFCVPGAFIEKTESGTVVHPRQADYTIVVVPPRDPFSPQDPRTLDAIRTSLLPRCLLGARLHVIDTACITIAVHATIRTRVARSREEWWALVQRQLDACFSPNPAAEAGESGWPFGRPVYTADIAEKLLDIEGVDSVDHIHFVAIWSAARVKPTEDDLVGIQVGIVSSVGRSTRIGAAPQLGQARLLEAGRLRGIALRPYELARVVMPAEGLRIVRDRELV